MINLFRFFVRDLNIRSFQVLRIELFRLMLNYLTFSFHDSQLFSFSFSFFKHDFSFNFNPSFSNIFNPRSPLSVSFHFRFSPQLEVYCNFSRVYEYRNGVKIDTLPTLHPAMESTQLSNPIIYAYMYASYQKAVTPVWFVLMRSTLCISFSPFS